MTLLAWGPELELGIPEVDRQHQRLVGLLNALDSGVKRGYSRNILGSVLEELVRYTVCHFTFEERLMETYDLPRTEEHRDEHERLTSGVLEFKARFDVGNVDVSDELLKYLRDWLHGHILGTDRGLVNMLLERFEGQGLSELPIPSCVGTGCG